MAKKIIFFIPNIDDGGIEKNLVLLSNYFIKKNLKVEIIYSRISKKILKKIDRRIDLIKIKNFINLKFINDRINNTINCFFYTLFKIRIKKNSILLSMQDHPVSIFISIIKQVPSVIRIANHPIGSLKFFNNSLKFRFKLFVKIFFYHFASIIICNSKASAIFLKKTLFINKKIITIYNPTVLKKFKKKFLRKKYNLITIGRLEKQKNLKGLIEAIAIVSKKLPKIRLTIIGKGSQKEELVQMVKKYKIKKIIKFKNFSDPDYHYMRNGIFLLNSYFEGLPNVLIECLQYKIPIISSNCLSGPSEILAGGKYGYLVEVNNHFKLARKIINVLKNYEKALQKADLAYHSLGRYDFDKQCEKYTKSILKL